MKACFPIVGEKEHKVSTSSTKRRQCVFTKLRVESVFISFVSFSFNSPHVSVSTRTSIRAIGAIRVLKNIRVIRSIRVQKSRVQKNCERPAANKIRAIRVIRVRIKQSNIRVKRYSLNSGYSCSKTK